MNMSDAQTLRGACVSGVAGISRELYGLEIQRDLKKGTLGPEHKDIVAFNQLIDITRQKLEDIAETETIFSTLMGEDVEARRKFIEDNALDVKNLDI